MGIHILVGAVCERHDLAHGLRVVELLVECGDARRRGGELPIQRGIRQFAREHAAALGDETGATAGDVHQFADQVRVHARGEIAEREVDVVDSGAEFGGEVIAQRLGRQALEVASGGDEGAA